MPRVSLSQLESLSPTLARQLRERGESKPRRVGGQMNKTERAYADVLARQLAAGLIRWFAFEAITWKLAPDTRYTPDFAVLNLDGSLEFREVKGRKVVNGREGYYSRDDAKLKIKLAAQTFPHWRFCVVHPIRGGGWAVHDFATCDLIVTGQSITIESLSPGEDSR